MFVAKLVIRNEDEYECMNKNHWSGFFDKANVMAANVRIGDEMPRVKVYSWDDSNVSDYEAFHRFFEFFPSMYTYGFVMSIDGVDYAKGRRMLKDVVAIRKMAVLTSNPICARTY